jgi:type I restriction enzyme, S subunit
MGTTWTTGRLGSVCRVVPGYAFKSSDWQIDGIPIVKIKNITGNNTVDLATTDCVPHSLLTPKLQKYVLKDGDILVAMTGATAGKVGKVRTNRLLLLNQRVAKIAPIEADPDFIWAVVSSKEYQEKFFYLADGAAQPNMSGSQIEGVEVPLPPLPIQRRIAGILSAYDELIENSQRRVKILEAMARTLYREWFVHFRFPGHESTPRIPSPLGEIPQGWVVCTLGEHLAALESGKRPKGGIRDVEGGVPSIGAENINGIGQHDFVSEKFVPREFFLEMRKGVVNDRDVAIYKDGAYIGKSSYFRDGFPHSECCVNEHVFLLRANCTKLRQNALYLWLQEPDTVQTIRSRNTNAAQPGINQQTVNGLVLTLPDSKTAENFDALVEPLFAEVINLAKKTQNLRRTRDLLLPRLLSGQATITGDE